MTDNLDIPEVLRRPAIAATPGSRAAALLGGTDTGAYTGLTLGDLVYDRVSIDPLALQGFEFAHKPVAGDIHRLATWAHGTLDGGHGTVEGRINRLQGYVFEKMAAAALRQGGVVVEFPDKANNPGWDLIVNGEKVQAKCGLSARLVHEHFAMHPDVQRVVVNEELASYFPHDDRVMVIGGITRDFVRSQTDQSLHAAADMLELNLIRVAPALSVIRNAWALWKKDTDWQGAAGNVAVDGATRLAGAKVGHAVGLVAAAALGGWPAVLVPVLGSAVGYRGGRAIAAQIKRLVLLRREHAALDEATRAWCAGSARVLGLMVDQAARAGARFRSARDRAGPSWTPLMDDWLDRLQAEQAYRRLHQSRFERAAVNPSSTWNDGGPLEVARAAMLSASRAGLLPSDLSAERDQVTIAATAYFRGLRRRLVA